jgi:hypothetical protein
VELSPVLSGGQLIAGRSDAFLRGLVYTLFECSGSSRLFPVPAWAPSARCVSTGTAHKTRHTKPTFLSIYILPTRSDIGSLVSAVSPRNF